MSFSERQKIVYSVVKASGIGNVKGKNILDKADASGVDSFLFSVKNLCSQTEYAEIKSNLYDADFEEIYSKTAAKGIGFVTYLDKEYPESLRPYTDMPLIIYYKGDVSLLNAPSFAVIGTRYPTRYGIRAAQEFVTNLSERFVIVSGMARGIDSVSHRAALDAGNKTIAVLGSGVDVVYPPENFSLYREIIEKGLIISEYEPGTPAISYNFPARNRIISGLSRGVLVTEAGERSGTILTVNNAIKQGKDVYCVPGNIYSKQSAGCNRLIRECQSRSVVDVNDIYDDMGLKKEDIKIPDAMQLDFTEEVVVKYLETNGPTHFEELLDRTELSVPQLTGLLIKMEALGLINKTGHNYWSV